MSPNQLAHKRILFFVGDIYEDLELWYPKLRLIEAGAEVVVAGQEANVVYAGKNGYPCKSDAAISDMQAADFAKLYGGFGDKRFLAEMERLRERIRKLPPLE